MRKTGFKLFLPFAAILYCIAFFEIEIGDMQQTWGDAFDTYVTSAHSDNIGASDYSLPDFVPASASLPSPFVFFNADLRALESSHPKSNCVAPPLQRLFLRNCTWLI